jgi:hypothetical protein
MSYEELIILFGDILCTEKTRRMAEKPMSIRNHGYSMEWTSRFLFLEIKVNEEHREDQSGHPQKGCMFEERKKADHFQGEKMTRMHFVK